MMLKRNFLSGDCSFGSDCWYVHEDAMDTDDMSDNFKCNVCEVEVKGRDNVMKHKKKNHIENIPTCDKFAKSQKQARLLV